MHPLHDYIAGQLAKVVREKRIVVWYDERTEFLPFVYELRGGPRVAAAPVALDIAGTTAHLIEYAGSMFELRAHVEPHVCGDEPEPVVIYLPGCVHDHRGSALKELEVTGTTWHPQLAQIARAVLGEQYTLGVIDEMLPYGHKLSYADLARASRADGS